MSNILLESMNSVLGGLEIILGLLDVCRRISGDDSSIGTDLYMKGDYSRECVDVRG